MPISAMYFSIGASFASQDKQWDRLCDLLAGRGVPSLDEALINLELRPVHDALRAALDPSVVRLLGGLAEVPHTPGKIPEKRTGTQQSEFFEHARARFEALQIGRASCRE